MSYSTLWDIATWIFCMYFCMSMQILSYINIVPFDNPYLNVIVLNRNSICLKLIVMLLLLCFLLTDSLSAVATATASTTDSCTGNVVWAIACFQSKISFIPREGTVALRKENCCMKLSIQNKLSQSDLSLCRVRINFYSITTKMQSTGHCEVHTMGVTWLLYVFCINRDVSYLKRRLGVLKYLMVTMDDSIGFGQGMKCLGIGT